ncbi:MAG: hypothetical protein H6509_10135 [Bryobacterales bacterium]|nr:hypothetical protein [Acidobacteriota bacterium]MCB9384966.1 hypothetical protein [Bryobacterales bacterium]
MTAAEAGLCGSCRHCVRVRSDRGSVFYRCELAKTDPRYAKYPRLPVLHCPGWEKAPAPDATL